MTTRQGAIERSVRADLRAFPEDMRKGAIAASALMLARQLDAFGEGMSPRDVAGYTREIRLAITTLRDQAPGEVKGDVTDEVRAKREERMRAATGE